MGTEFTPIFLYVVVAVATAVGMAASTSLIGPRKTTAVKQMPYESGMDPVGDTHQRFDIRFYLVAIVFLLFDVELLFIYPWAVAQFGGADALHAAPVTPGAVVASASADDQAKAATQTPAPAKAKAQAGKTSVAGVATGVPKEFRWLVFWAVMFLIVLLTAADAYAWRKGVFEWR